MKALITCPSHPYLEEHLEQHDIHCDKHPNMSYDQLLSCISEYEIIVIATSIPIDKRMLESATKLQIIGRLGSGMEHVDSHEANLRGIKLISTPEGNAKAVAEFVLGLVINNLRNIAKSNTQVHQAIWQRSENRGHELHSQSIGIVGYGNNGSATATLMKLAGLEVHVYDKYITIDDESLHIHHSYQSLLESVDILSFHVPYNTETNNYFDTESLSIIKKPIHLINISRGEIVNPYAVWAGISDGKLLSVSLDVIIEERRAIQDSHWVDVLPIYKLLLANPNVIITPHIAGYSFESRFKMAQILAFRIITEL